MTMKTLYRVVIGSKDSMYILEEGITLSQWYKYSKFPDVRLEEVNKDFYKRRNENNRLEDALTKMRVENRKKEIEYYKSLKREEQS